MIGDKVRKQPDRLPGQFFGIPRGGLVCGDEQALELLLEQVPGFDDRLAAFHDEGSVVHPPVRQIAVEGDPEQGPALGFQRAVAVPFPRPVEKRVSGMQGLAPRHKRIFCVIRVWEIIDPACFHG